MPQGRHPTQDGATLPESVEGTREQENWPEKCSRKEKSMSRRQFVLIAAAALALTFGGGATAADGPAILPDGMVWAVESYDVNEVPAAPVTLSTPPGNGSRLLWGYEASFANSRVLSYDIGPPVVAGPFCVPDAAAGGPTGNGRGVAFDPLDGNLWTSRLTIFAGDGLIHKITPPNVTPGVCPQVDVIPFGDGPGGVVQDDIGAIDVDEASKHLWVAGYLPVSVQGLLRAFIYKVNRNNGEIINYCWIPPGPLDGNDTLTSARLPGLPGSGRYLLTDAEEFTPTAPIQVLDQADCHDGQMVVPVTSFAKNQGMTGIDFEYPGLLNTNLSALFNNGNQPFTTATPHGPFGNSTTVEDISLCAFRAKFGGDGNDKCPY
jgi:hypothetical protein